MKSILKFLAPLSLLLCLLYAATGCSGGLGAIIRYDNAKKYTAAASGELTLPVNNLEVEWVSGEVNIEDYEGTSVKFSEVRSDGVTETDDYTMRYLLDQTDDTLHLKFAKSGVRNNNLSSKALTVRIPRNTTLNSVEVETVSAETVVSVHADACDIETVSGEIACRNASYGEIEAKTVSGTIAVKNVTVARKTEIDSVSGDVVAAFVTLPVAVEAKSVSGDVTLYLPDAGFSVKFDTVSGTFYSGFRDTPKYETVTGGALVNAGSPSCHCTVKTVSGDLYVVKFVGDQTTDQK